MNNNEVQKVVTVEEINRLTDLALRGDAEAQNELAVCYYYGEGMEQDHSKIEYWLNQAAAQDYALAQYNLGEYYYEKTLEDNYLSETEYEACCQKAFYWFSKAANQGNSDAMVRLSNCYGLGIGVKYDQEKASEWLHKSAELGNSLAQSAVGIEAMLASNDEEAIKWFRLSAAQGNDFSQRELDNYRLGWQKSLDSAKVIHHNPLIHNK